MFFNGFFGILEVELFESNAKSPISAELSRIKNLKGLSIFWPYFRRPDFVVTGWQHSFLEVGGVWRKPAGETLESKMQL